MTGRQSIYQVLRITRSVDISVLQHPVRDEGPESLSDGEPNPVICSSPSLWWDNEATFDIERQRPDSDQLDPEVFFGIGLLETDAGRCREAFNLADGHPAKPPAAPLDMVNDLGRFVDQLNERTDPTLRSLSAEIEDEFHTTVPAIVLNRALRSSHATAQGAK